MATIWFVDAQAPGLSTPGIERSRVYRFMRALMRAGHEVVLFRSDVSRFDGTASNPRMDSAHLDETAPNLTVRTLKTTEYKTTLGRFLQMLHFERMVIGNHKDLPRPDLVIGKTVHPFAAHAGLRLARRYRAPFMLEVGDIWPQTLVDMGSLSRINPVYWLLRAVEIRLYRGSARIISKLPLGKVHVAASHADARKVVWVPNSADVSQYLAADYPEAPPVRSEFVVAYTGSMTPVYGLENLLEAAAITQSRGLPIRFRLVGAGQSRQGLMEEARRRELANVTFTDRVAYTEIPAILGDADACIALFRDLSVVRDFGMSLNKLTEYMGAKRPVIFAVRSANDPVSDARAGISVPPEDPQAIAEAAEALYRMTREERIAMGQRAHAYVADQFSADGIIHRLTSLVEEVLESMEPGTLVHPDVIG